MKRPLSLTTRISLLFATAGAVALLIAGVVFERAGNYRFRDHDREELQGKLDLTREILRSSPNLADSGALDRRFRDMAFGHPGMAMVLTVAGHIVYAAGGQRVLAHLEVASDEGQGAPVTWSDDEHSYRIARARYLKLGTGVPDATVAIALDITEDQTFLQDFREFLWFGILQVALGLGWLSWLITRRGLAPLERLSAQVALISAKALDQPMPSGNVPRELESLVDAFNTMLLRLHEAFARLSEFSDDIAHELRTPVNNLLLQTQVTLDGHSDLDAYRSALQANEAECQRLAHMISDMLFIAKADNRQLALRLEPLRLGDEVDGLLDFYENLASARDITLDRSGDARVIADRMLIRRALSNLLSNAIRYTDEGGTVRVALEATSDGAMCIKVVNPGPEIPIAARERVFERLYRVERARSELDAEGRGLGLAIVKAIAELHGGSVGVTCADGYTSFEIRLPSGE
ncbi:heavy metal sensor histidine kinase [Thiomonas sp. FB-Cd]|uniref:heavy metal sensor histidine kinase n=1 Tax=Thiomonas sp. FB-Cd TaxID=1158292 RepID=UPI0004DF1560|nr:heavy metal sensor histidine kinase [Thiomonas sp. FB-Cd]